MSATSIMTVDGWRPLWTISEPKRPPYHTSKPIDAKRAEQWMDEQHAKLLRLHAWASARPTPEPGQ